MNNSELFRYTVFAIGILLASMLWSFASAVLRRLRELISADYDRFGIMRYEVFGEKGIGICIQQKDDPVVYLHAATKWHWKLLLNLICVPFDIVHAIRPEVFDNEESV